MNRNSTVHTFTKVNFFRCCTSASSTLSIYFLPLCFSAPACHAVKSWADRLIIGLLQYIQASNARNSLIEFRMVSMIKNWVCRCEWVTHSWAAGSGATVKHDGTGLHSNAPRQGSHSAVAHCRRTTRGWMARHHRYWTDYPVVLIAGLAHQYRAAGPSTSRYKASLRRACCRQLMVGISQPVNSPPTRAVSLLRAVLLATSLRCHFSNRSVLYS